ncbi:MAG: S-methyl-5'-thioinosine phosphorylase [Pseudomonadota bacterium]
MPHALGLMVSCDLKSSADFASGHSTCDTTPYGDPSAPLHHTRLAGHSVIVLQRHGLNHQIPPHQINYRANLWSLRAAGAQQIIGLATVGGIHPELEPGTISIPDQIIDYTYGREHTFATTLNDTFGHIDFSTPYCTDLRHALINAAQSSGIACVTHGVYGATQGPRLETAAEIRRLQQDGCDMVGMTGMPEASLARELGLDYACLALMVNKAAGLGDDIIDLQQITECRDAGLRRVLQIIQAYCGQQATIAPDNSSLL